MTARIPHRQFCGICRNTCTVAFWVPDKIWEAVVREDEAETIHCLNCFTRFADEKLIEWCSAIRFIPVSLAVSILYKKHPGITSIALPLTALDGESKYG